MNNRKKQQQILKEEQPILSSSELKQDNSKMRLYLSAVVLILVFLGIMSYFTWTYIELYDSHQKIQQELKLIQTSFPGGRGGCAKIETELLLCRKSLDEFHSSKSVSIPENDRRGEIIRHAKYTLRDVLLLSKHHDDVSVMNTFMKKWQQDDGRYLSCGRTENRILSDQVRDELSVCDVAIITSWYPRPCGIATHSGKLVEALKKVCPEHSRIHVIAVRNDDEFVEKNSAVNSDIIKFSFRKNRAAEYISAGRYIAKNRYGTVLLAYEFGLYFHESILCLLSEVQSRVIVILHTLSADLPWKYQALTQQVPVM